MKPVTWDDLDTAARTVYGEARGESWDGKHAVANVIVNRAKIGGWWGSSICTVCLFPYQFSCWNENDPNREKCKKIGYDNPVLRECLRAVLHALDIHDDRTNGATHYFVTNMPNPPAWFDPDKVMGRIGSHTFLKGV